MKQLTCIAPGKLKWRDVPEPTLLSPTDAIVRPFMVGRCDGDCLFARTRPGLMRWAARLGVIDRYFAAAHRTPFQMPFPCGHECVAEVVDVGPEVTSVAPGMWVVVPWAISCGGCSNCLRGLTSHCTRDRSSLRAYGFAGEIGGDGGMLSDLLRVPYANFMLVPAPQHVDTRVLASASDNLSDAYRAVAPGLAQEPGAPVLVLGGAAKSIALYAVAIAQALGSRQVEYVDFQTQRLEIAEKLGATVYPCSKQWDLDRAHSPRAESFPIVVEATSSAKGLNLALGALAAGGAATSVSFHMKASTPVSLWPLYLKSATLRVGVSHPRRDLPAVLSLIRSGRLKASAVVTQTIGWEDAAEAYLSPTTKLVVMRQPLFAPLNRADLSGGN